MTFRVIRVGMTLALAFAAGMTQSVAGAREIWILADLNQARQDAGVPELIRRPVLDQIARVRAEKIAGLAQRRRMSFSDPLEGQIRDAGIKWFTSATVRVDLVRGHASPAAVLISNWRNYRQAWNSALDPQQSAIGLASKTASDGWIVFVAVLLKEIPAKDTAVLERETLAAINAVRAEHDLAALRPSKELADIARAHSADMAHRGYFDHESPDGDGPVERAARAGVRTLEFGENIQMSRGNRDPVKLAVESWMDSPGHRKLILTPGFEETGVGVATDDEAGIFFTQLFAKPYRQKRR